MQVNSVFDIIIRENCVVPELTFFPLRKQEACKFSWWRVLRSAVLSEIEGYRSVSLSQSDRDIRSQTEV